MIGAMPVYFAYGSNMSSARLRSRVSSARSLGAVHVTDWRLAFDKPGRDGSGKANLVPSPGSLVWGVVWQLGESDWEILDRFEPGYQRARFRFEQGGRGAIEADAYLFDSTPGARVVPPTASYVAHIVAGAEEHGLPDEYVAWIRALT